MRELGLWDADAGVAVTFADVEALTANCRFRNCAHETEPGCAVQAALAEGRLDTARWRNYAKLQRELAHEVRKDDPRAQSEQRKMWSRRARAQRQRDRLRSGEDPPNED
jgi:ribosome biogenesis GTPase